MGAELFRADGRKTTEQSPFSILRTRLKCGFLIKKQTRQNFTSVLETWTINPLSINIHNWRHDFMNYSS